MLQKGHQHLAYCCKMCWSCSESLGSLSKIEGCKCRHRRRKLVIKPFCFISSVYDVASSEQCDADNRCTGLALEITVYYFHKSKYVLTWDRWNRWNKPNFDRHSWYFAQQAPVLRDQLDWGEKLVVNEKVGSNGKTSVTWSKWAPDMY